MNRVWLPQDAAFGFSFSKSLLATAIVLFCVLQAGQAADMPPAVSRPVDFSKDVQPILSEHCYSCHGPEKQKGDFRWDQKASLSKIGDHGPILVRGKSAESRVIQLVAGLDPDSVMPPKGERLSDAQIGILRAWIDQGAQWPEKTGEQLADKRNH